VPYRGEAPALTDLLGGQVNAPHCFPINAHDMRAFAMPASKISTREAPGKLRERVRGRASGCFWPWGELDRGKATRGKIGALSGEGHRFPRSVYPVEVNSEIGGSRYESGGQDFGRPP
jgi:hypothetical protein